MTDKGGVMEQVLLIEDEIKDVDTYPLILELKRSGYEVIVAKTGNEAVKKLSNKRFSCIIIDIMVPHGEDIHIPEDLPRRKMGIHILERILNNEFEKVGNSKETPVIIVTAIIDYEDEIKLRKMLKGEEFYLKKPVRPDVIVQTLKKAIEKTEKS